MLKSIFSIILSIFLLFSSYAQHGEISYFKYNNLTYANSKLYVNHSIRQEIDGNIVVINKDYLLSDSLRDKLLAGIDSIQILNVKSNNKVVIDGIPFTFEYQIANQPINKVHGHSFGMLQEERNILNRFNSFILQFTNYYYSHFRDSLPDGKYSKDRMMFRTPFEVKKNGVWYDPRDYPLVILDGKIVSPENISSILNIKDKYQIEILKGAEATALYGSSRAANGVVILTTK